MFIYGQMITNIRWSFRVNLFFVWRLVLTILNPIYLVHVFGLGPGIILQYF